MRLCAIVFSGALAALAVPAAAQDGKAPPPPPALPGEKPAETPANKLPSEAVWTKTKIIVCEVLGVQHCRPGGCAPAAKLPSFRIDIARQTMCGLTSSGCGSTLRIGQVGFDRAGTRMSLHALGVAFVIGVDADGMMNGADVVKGRVVAIQGRCVPG
jgi:hypothetical protein